jgi:RNA recognition motif-containing protein
MSNRKLYVGNLPFSFEDGDLAQLFSQAGSVVSARVVLDPATGRKRGFGFVEMSSDGEAEEGKKMFNGADVQGRSIVVDIAQERPRREGGGGGGGFRGGDRPRRHGGGGGGHGQGGYGGGGGRR